MNGRVENLQAILPVTLRLETGQALSIEFIADSGFTGSLTLPVEAIEKLGLPFERRITIELADSSLARVALHFATIDWLGKPREVRVLAMDGRPLLGTTLLKNCRFGVEFWEGGNVIVTPK